jgi:phosphate transport system ATP-binding protein
MATGNNQQTKNRDSQQNPKHSRDRHSEYNNARANTDDVVLRTEELNTYYGDFLALRDITMDIPANQITAFIGPSGCGKSTLLRCFNRLNDPIKGFRAEGKVYYYDQDLYGDKVDPVEVRRRIGIVFQKPNPFPKSVFDNVAYGPRVIGAEGDMDELVERCLKQAALWDEVKDKLKESAQSLSGGQQQRLCIARALAIEPEVLLMDEPCSALDPIATGSIEDLMHELKEDYTILIVTHNMQQASRVADMTAFLNAVVLENQTRRTGELIEFECTEVLFDNPTEEATQQYISGNFG